MTERRFAPQAATPLAALGFTLLADFLFYRHPLGGNAALMAFALTALLLLRCGRRRLSSTVLLLAGYNLLLVAALLGQPGIIALTLSALFLPLLALATRRSSLAGAWYGARSVCAFFLVGWVKLFQDLPRLRHPALPIARTARSIGRWLIPLGLTAGFVYLFSLANPVLAEGIGQACSQLARWIQDWLVLPPLARVVFWMVALLFLWALLRWRPAAPRLHPPPLPLPPQSGFAAGAIVRCLALFNLAFVVQNGMDAYYLWGGGTLPAGMTYAEYAHRGAYPLVATALLAGAFVLFTFAPGRATVRHPWARALVFAWIAQNVLLTASAAWRLHLYVEVYGLTRLRLASALWMLLVAGGLILICWRIWGDRRNSWLLNANAIQLLALLTVCAFAHPDQRIAWHNVRHSREAGGTGPAFDFRYARVHGEAALPALRWLAANSRDAFARGRAEIVVGKLESELEATRQDWRSWTWSRHRLRPAPPPPPA